MIAAITYVGKRNDRLGLYPFKRFVSADAIPSNIQTLIKESPAFASQFVDAEKFKQVLARSKRLSPKPPTRKMLPARRVPVPSPIRKN